MRLEPISMSGMRIRLICDLDTVRLHRMARHLAFTRALHECPEEITADLEQAAWIKFLTLKKADHLWKDLEYAMLEELSRWIWQCKRGRGKNRRLTIKLTLGEFLRKLEKPTIPKDLMRDTDIERFYS